MTINLDSTTDSKEAVTAALGDLAKPADVVETPKEETTEGEEQEKLGGTEQSSDLEVEDSEEEESEESSDSEEEEIQNEDPKPKKKGGFQKRIDKLLNKVSVAEQNAELWRQQALRGQQNPEKQTATLEIKPDLSKKPKADEFGSHEEFVEALTDWKLEQKLSVRDQKQRDESVKTEVQGKLSKHRERVDKVAAAKDDWAETTGIFNDPSLSLAVKEVIVDSEHGPEIMYALGKDRKELNRILALTPLQAAKELGKIESRFSKSTESSSEKKVSKAPAPVSPVRTRGTSVSKSIYDESLSQRDYERLREEQLKTLRR